MSSILNLENSIEKGNKLNLQYRKLFSRKFGLLQENKDIFKRRLLTSDPYLIIEGVKTQQKMRGKIRKKRRNEETSL